MQLCELNHIYWTARGAVTHIFLMVEVCKCPLDVYTLQKTKELRCLETSGRSYSQEAPCLRRTSTEVKSSFSFLNNQPDALIIPMLFCYKTPHVSGIFSAHHQEFSTVHSVLLSFMQVFDNRFQAESGWNSFPSWLYLKAVIKNLHETYHCRMYSRKLLVMGREDARNM